MLSDKYQVDISWRSVHVIVWEQKEIEHLISFCEHKHVKKYAYIKHIPKNPEGRIHYHFWFKFNSLLPESYILKILNVKRIQIYRHEGSTFSILRYFVKGSSLEFPTLKNELVTNVWVNEKALYAE